MEKIDAARDAWLDSQKEKTRRKYASHWKKFAEFTKMTGDEIVVSKKADTEFVWEKKVVEFHEWLMREKKAAPNSALAITGAIRGFFGYHRLGLTFRKKETRKLGENTRVTEDYHFSLKDTQKMADVGDVKEKYILIAGKSFGFRAGDFLRLARGDLEPYLEEEPPISIGVYQTEKEKVPAYPFIDIDTKPIIKLMLENMTREGRTGPKERILEYSHEEELSRVLRRLAAQAGINPGTKRIRFHCLRKFLSDHLSSYMSESKWKQVVGKKISESAYVSAETLREDYRRAMPDTTFTYSRNEDIQKVVKKEALLAMTRAMGITETDLRTMFKRKVTTEDEEIEEIERILAERQKLRDNNQQAAGGLAFQELARKELASLFVGAIEDVKKKLNQAS